MKNAIDLYSGIGGWTLGMKLSGIKSIASFEWWKEANNTHNRNFDTNHKEIDIRAIDIKKDLVFSEKIDFVVGSPPCTQFSFANRGGNGNIQDGLVDVYKFLEIVEYLQPKYWAMENIPRVADILEKEMKDGALKRFSTLVKNIIVVDAADYGVPQNRKRMIAGNFPLSLFQSYKSRINPISLGDVVSALRKKPVADPNYGFEIDCQELTEMDNEADLTREECRINKDSKTFHPVYNGMSFPDKLDRPSRTITATCTRVSRESIILKSESGYRRLNVRERAVLQSFPITFQFYGQTLNSKFKMIGNAIPPLLTYYVFQSMLEVPLDHLKLPSELGFFHVKPEIKPIDSNLGLPARRYPDNRKFQFAVPHLRYGSGVRFELSNVVKSSVKNWSFKFYYGNSKNIRELPLNSQLISTLSSFLKRSVVESINEQVAKIFAKYQGIDSVKLQELWVSSSSNYEVFTFLDDVGKSVHDLLLTIKFDDHVVHHIESILSENNRKLTDNKDSLLVGFYFLSSLNCKFFEK